MVKISDHEEFLNASMVESGDLLEFVDEGRFIEGDESPFGRAIFEIRVKLPDASEKTWTVNRTTCRKIAEAYGDETKEWVGKKVEIEVVRQNVRGELKDVLYGKPVKEGEDNDKDQPGDESPTQARLTEEEALEALKGLKLSEEEKKKQIENLRKAGLI